jgi:glutaredoxin 3
MFKVFLLLSIAAVSFVLYNTYIKTNSKPANIVKTDGESIIYTKSYCPYCVKAKNLLTALNISYKEVNLNSDPDLHQALIKETNQHTVPYIYLRGIFIGGCDDLYALHEQGKV